MRAFRTLKSIDLKVRPIFHRLEGWVRARVFLCMLAYYVEWRLRGSVSTGSPRHSFHTLLQDLATLSKNHVRQKTHDELFDQNLCTLFEDLGIGYVCGGKLYDGLKACVAALDPAARRRYGKREQVWDYVEFVCPDTLYYTNLGRGGTLDAQLCDAGYAHWLSA